MNSTPTPLTDPNDAADASTPARQAVIATEERKAFWRYYEAWLLNASDEELEQLQLERLQATLNRAYKNVTCYRSKFNDLGIVPEDVTSLADLSKLPFTTKEDLRVNYPYGMFAVPLREVVRIHSSRMQELGNLRQDFGGDVARFLHFDEEFVERRNIVVALNHG